MQNVIWGSRFSERRQSFDVHSWTSGELAEYSELLAKIEARIDRMTPCSGAADFPARSDQGDILSAAQAAWDLRNRQTINFPSYIFADPAWGMLLHYLLGNLKNNEVSIRSGCRASGCEIATALRWLGELAGNGIIVRNVSGCEVNRTLVTLSNTGLKKMAAVLIG